MQTRILAATVIAAVLGANLAVRAADHKVQHRYAVVDEANVFYREAGVPGRPVVLLLHGFGASSHMFRHLIPKLSGKYHVLAPDLPGFGYTTVSKDAAFRYTFDNLANVIDRFASKKGLNKYALYVFDYGAPVGWRLAVRHPEKVTAIVSQNGNAYEEGLSEGWADMRRAWQDPTAENREKLRKFNTLETTRWQYTAGVADPGLIAPETYHLAQAATDRVGVDAQLDLLIDYRTNIVQYSQVQEYFRAHRPPTLAVWGRNDPFFVPAGAQAFRRDNPSAEVHLLDTGHFAIETHGDEIAALILDFFARKLPK